LKELVADVLADNVPMLNVFRRSGLLMSKRFVETTVEVTLRFPVENRDPRQSLDLAVVRGGSPVGV
jgi:hypothetical protein